MEGGPTSIITSTIGNESNLNELNSVVSVENETITNLEEEADLIIKAFGADFEEKNARQCPGCGEIYAQKIGCNYVRCPNLQCNTWFCWGCGKDDISWMHFLVKRCKPGYEDILKALYPLKFFVFLPLSVNFGVPAYFAKHTKINSVLVKICLFVVLLPIGSALSVLSLFPITFIWLFYLALSFVKLIPIVGQISMLFEFAEYITSFFGYGDWFGSYKRAEEGRRAERARNRLHRLEQRKRRIKTP
ncbi:hypothetical protein niasHS_013507 [Heterodera schachtii]|uniref:IBR domain-containing protein n=2 Tax=Heterodera TaxID=34509 RepID=A0ABD2IC66_HETSC